MYTNMLKSKLLQINISLLFKVTNKTDNPPAISLSDWALSFSSQVFWIKTGYRTHLTPTKSLHHA